MRYQVPTNQQCIAVKDKTTDVCGDDARTERFWNVIEKYFIYVYTFSSLGCDFCFISCWFFLNCIMQIDVFSFLAPFLLSANKRLGGYVSVIVSPNSLQTIRYSHIFLYIVCC